MNTEDGKAPTSNPSQSWAWGEFPKNMTQQMSPTTENAGDVDPNQDQQSMLSHVFSFMKQNKHRHRNSKTDGVYLADISSGAIEPEVASLYFTTNNYKRNTGNKNSLSTLFVEHVNCVAMMGFCLRVVCLVISMLCVFTVQMQTWIVNQGMDHH